MDVAVDVVRAAKRPVPATWTSAAEPAPLALEGSPLEDARRSA